jgi:hypothetical protein
MKRYFGRQNPSFPSTVPLALLIDNSACRISREFWWTNQEFSSVDIPPWFSMPMYHLGDEQ